MFYQALQEHVRRRRLRSALQSTRIFGALDPAVHDLETELTWVTLRSGETLIRQGDPGDCLYVVISGRLRIVLERDGAEVRTVREVGRGESIGEMALITGEQRAATVYAIRDTEVVRLSQAGFDRLLAQHPHAMTRTFTRSIIESLTRASWPAKTRRQCLAHGRHCPREQRYSADRVYMPVGTGAGGAWPGT